MQYEEFLLPVVKRNAYVHYESPFSHSFEVMSKVKVLARDADKVDAEGVTYVTAS